MNSESHVGDEPTLSPRSAALHGASQRQGEVHSTEIHLPAPSVWPLTAGAGFSLMAFGVATSLALSFLGLILLVCGVWLWIQELRHA
jgi:hypothetical protein